MTDSSQIAIPCFAGTGAKGARDDGFIADRRAKKAYAMLFNRFSR